MATQFYLARHGETIWNTEQRFQGHLNSELTLKGEKQSQALAHFLTSSPLCSSIDVIISSNLGRAIDTALICQKDLYLPHHIYPELTERHLGAWQGEKLQTLKQHAFYADIFQKVNALSPPEGESGIDCAVRMEKALREIAKDFPNKKILVIVHGEALRCFMEPLREKTGNAVPSVKKNAYELYQNTSVQVVTLSDEKLDNPPYIGKNNEIATCFTLVSQFNVSITNE